LHVLPYGFVVDGQDGIKDPIGMLGVRLVAYVHIITGGITAARNLVKSVNRAGLRVDDMVLAPLASGEAVLTKDERELGCVLIDIGAGTTDILVYVDGSVRHSTVIPIGGDQATADISCGLRTPHSHAEALKIEHGVALPEMVNGEAIPVPSVGDRDDRSIPRRELVEILHPRMDELLYLARMQVHKSGYLDFVAGGVVLTGGSAMLPGLVDMAEGIFGCPVRLGQPRFVLGDDGPGLEHPRYATACGLAQWRLRTQGEQQVFRNSGRGVNKLMSRMREWAGDLF